MEAKDSKLYDIFCDKCGEYLGSYIIGIKAKCPDCDIYSSAKINDSNNRKEDTR
jgi:hypothetical protein